MIIRVYEPGDWPALAPIVAEVVAAGESYCRPRDSDDKTNRRWWTGDPETEVVVAVDEASASVLGTAQLHPNRPGPGAHVANASFMVASWAGGRGVGRALGTWALQTAADRGYRSMQFNSVVETNEVAVRLWRSLGFTVLATVPEAFDHPLHGLVGLHVMWRSLRDPSPPTP